MELIFNPKYSEHIAVITPRAEEFSYGELYQYSTELVKQIDSRSLVFCLCKNTMGSFVGYASFISNGIVPVMLDGDMDQTLFNNLLARYQPQYLWVPDPFVHSVNGYEEMTKLFGYTLLKNTSGSKNLLHDNLALLLTTSGSTGSPKLVRLTYENLYSNAKSISEYLSIDENERPITSLPMHYSFGLSIINSHLLTGSTVLLTDNTIMERDFWSFLKKYKATSLSGVPYTFEILKKLRFSSMDLPNLHTLTQAGGKLNETLNREYSEFCRRSGKRLFVMYGQTEATARMSYLPPEHSLSKLGSMGIAVPGGEFSLIDEKGEVINDPDTEGELVYRGKNVSMGYAECRADLTKADENQGVLVTGDMAKRDADGFYYIVGRKKRFIKMYGNRVNLDETEKLLNEVTGDCVCVGDDDKMIVYITDASRAEEVKNYLAKKIKLNRRGFDIRGIAKIPKNTSGKTIYSELAI